MSNNTFINPTQDQILVVNNFPDDQSLCMLNLLKYKTKTADGISGKEQYKIYMKEASPFIEKSKGKVIYYGNALQNFIGPDESEWDKVLIIQYPTKNNFLEMLQMENYPTHLRAAALEDSRLIICTGI